MEIVVAVKPVPEAEAKLRVRPDGRALEEDSVKFVLAGYDESAVEQALLLKDATAPSTVTAVAFGLPNRCEEVLRSCLALGCDRAVVVDAPGVEALADPMRVARGLAAGLAGRTVDLLLFGKQAGDDEEGLVGPATAQRLGLPFGGSVTDLRWDAAAQQFTFRRPVDAGEETWTASRPVAIGLQQAWNDPRTAKLPAILKSRKAAVDHAPEPPATDLPKSVGEGFALPPPRTGAKILEYRTPEEAAQKLLRALREEAKVLP